MSNAVAIDGFDKAKKALDEFSTSAGRCAELMGNMTAAMNTLIVGHDDSHEITPEWWIKVREAAKTRGASSANIIGIQTKEHKGHWLDDWKKMQDEEDMATFSGQNMVFTFGNQELNAMTAIEMAEAWVKWAAFRQTPLPFPDYKWECAGKSHELGLAHAILYNRALHVKLDAAGIDVGLFKKVQDDFREHIDKLLYDSVDLPQNNSNDLEVNKMVRAVYELCAVNRKSGDVEQLNTITGDRDEEKALRAAILEYANQIKEVGEPGVVEAFLVKLASYEVVE